jgi:hypothetical protein
MENTISHFQVEGLEIKLTEDKLFINTLSSNEAFALRSIDGIGVIDLVEDFNNSLITYKKSNRESIAFYVAGGLFFLVGLITLPAGIGAVFFSLIFILAGFLKGRKNFKPTLKSAVRIMMSGGNRDFTFDKADTKSQNIAEFVANVENTLTAFHKNN